MGGSVEEHRKGQSRGVSQQSQHLLSVIETSFKTPSSLQLFTAFLIFFLVSKSLLGPSISCGKEISKVQKYLWLHLRAMSCRGPGVQREPETLWESNLGRSLNLLKLQSPQLETRMITAPSFQSCHVA